MESARAFVHSGPCQKVNIQGPNHYFDHPLLQLTGLPKETVAMSTNNRTQGAQGEKTYFEQQRELVLQDVATVGTSCQPQQ
jgi:hypothetical protein